MGYDPQVQIYPFFALGTPAMKTCLKISFLAFGVLFSLFSSVALGQSNAPSIVQKAKVGQLDFKIGNKVVTTYHYGPEVAKPYFWPIITLGENRVTRDWPMLATSTEAKDHKHQKSAWFCHGDIIPEGIELKRKSKGVSGVDFWSEEGNHGKIVCTKISNIENKNSSASVSTLNEWLTPDGIKILDESRSFTLQTLGNGYIIKMNSSLNASVCNITFGDTKEGSFGVRVRDSFTESAKKGGILTNAQGKQTEKAIWGMESNWCDYSGPADKGIAGITIIADANNSFKSCWHSRGYGLMAANPFGRSKSGFPDRKENKDLAKINKGDSLKLSFSLFVHDGNAEEAKVKELAGK